ncbi:MAG: FAD-binding oxidoreductase [Ectothiorhodospiraceae bacterium]|nr:FAD-binding oxidoreductase [Ectothiorhodospiraceae bacterium]
MDYQGRVQELNRAFTGGGGQTVRLKKRTTSNLFRYHGRRSPAEKRISLSGFNHVLNVCEESRTLEVEGLATYGQIVAATLPRGLVPTVTPELRHITVGGATVGIGIESSGHRDGFVHDGLVEADVLLADGRVVTCSPDNAYADLFHALPNSYGTLGYILRAVIRLVPAQPYVHIRHQRFHTVREYLAAMEDAVRRGEDDFIEGLVFGRDALYLTRGRFTQRATTAPDDIYRTIYYRSVSRRTTMLLPTDQYLFRFDPDWFWNIPDTGLYRLFRRLAPRRLRSSAFYNRFTGLRAKARESLRIRPDTRTEKLIQDWEVPWTGAEQLLDFALDRVDLAGQPWAAVPIVPQSRATLYPLKQNTLYFNLGSYCLIPRVPGKEADFHTRIMDEECLRLGGIKMLYSSSFFDPATFNRVYNGSAYDALKSKYDPDGVFPTLFEKATGLR